MALYMPYRGRKITRYIVGTGRSCHEETWSRSCSGRCIYFVKIHQERSKPISSSPCPSISFCTDHTHARHTHTHTCTRDPSPLFPSIYLTIPLSPPLITPLRQDIHPFPLTRSHHAPSNLNRSQVPRRGPAATAEDKRKPADDDNGYGTG